MARTRPLGRIALSLSGGGYRAAAFHLGTLDLLHRLDLLRDVAVLSSVSGGSFTGLAYALSAARGEAFEAFQARFRSFLLDSNVVARALTLAADRSGDAPASLIRAAAQVYASPGCVGEARLGELLDAKSHLREIVASATDMASGLAFRFQKSRSRSAKNGTSRTWMSREAARDVRLADVLAASSCFPAAFEPMAFPDDFQWTKGRPPLDGLPLDSPLPLMDGGIYDNQAIDGLLLAERRMKKRGRAIGVFFVSDTSQRKLEIFRFPERGSPGGAPVGIVLRVAQLACALSAVLAAGRLALALGSGRVLPPEETLTLGVSFVVSAGVGASLLWAESKLRRAATEKVPGLAWESVLRLGTGELRALVEMRLRSLIALSADVFTRRIRALGYKRLFGASAYQGRRIANLVYELETAAPEAPWLEPSPAQRALAARAGSLPTQLWVERGSQLADLVACGQATACHNLLRHLVERYGERRAAQEPAVAPLFSRARELWERLKAQPGSLAP